MFNLSFKGLICEVENKVSIGRISFWLALIFSCYFWFYLPIEAFPPSLVQFLMMTMTYNLFKKGVNAYIEKSKFTNDMFTNTLNQTPQNNKQYRGTDGMEGE